MVIRALAPPANADGEPCRCRIEGTIEVESNKPLPKRTRVVISLVPNPANFTTVELFMGSPREFRLAPAPCGPQRLRLVNTGTMKFDVVSQEVLNGFNASRAKHQFRVIQTHAERVQRAIRSDIAGARLSRFRSGRSTLASRGPAPAA
jgi:hypothetical protein